MTDLVVAVALSAAAVMVLVRPSAVGSRRLHRMLPTGATSTPRRRGGRAVGLDLVRRLVRRRTAAGSPPPPEQVGLALDLLAGCLAAGLAVPDAVRAAGEAVGGGVGATLQETAAALDAGRPADDAWAVWLAHPDTRPAARAVVRAVDSGAPAAAAVGRAAVRQRDAVRAAAERRVRAAGVWSVLPLGLCFLPAFVLVGVVPVVLGLLRGLR